MHVLYVSMFVRVLDLHACSSMLDWGSAGSVEGSSGGRNAGIRCRFPAGILRVLAN